MYSRENSQRTQGRAGGSRVLNVHNQWQDEGSDLLKAKLPTLDFNITGESKINRGAYIFILLYTLKWR